MAVGSSVADGEGLEHMVCLHLRQGEPQSFPSSGGWVIDNFIRESIELASVLHYLPLTLLRLRAIDPLVQVFDDGGNSLVTVIPTLLRHVGF